MAVVAVPATRGRPRSTGAADEAPEEATPLVKEADPELERLLAEEEEIERRTRQHHEAPKFHGDERGLTHMLMPRKVRAPQAAARPDDRHRQGRHAG